MTVVSKNDDYGEVMAWADDNPEAEDRAGYFVCFDHDSEGFTVKKAGIDDDVRGVSIISPAFASNATPDKYDDKGLLLPKYTYIGWTGFVPIIDKGRCTAGGRCMPDSDGTAKPSSNNMGYQVIERIDDSRVLILVEPQGDMIQRIKTDINTIDKDLHFSDWDTEVDTGAVWYNGQKVYKKSLQNVTVTASSSSGITLKLFNRTPSDPLINIVRGEFYYKSSNGHSYLFYFTEQNTTGDYVQGYFIGHKDIGAGKKISGSIWYTKTE
jgi:hypothetical protein